MTRPVLVFVLIAAATLLPRLSFAAEEPSKGRPLPPIPLSLDEVLAWIDRAHPCSRARERTKSPPEENVEGPGRVRTDLHQRHGSRAIRFKTDPGKGTQTVGFNDTLVEARHPWGFRGSAGFRQAIGDAVIPDLSLGHNRQVLVGGFVPLLKGLMVNPENAELQRSEYADPRADVKISQTRQDLFLAAASQFWDWVSTAKFVDIQRRALSVAEERLRQVEGRAKAGAVARWTLSKQAKRSSAAGKWRLPPNALEQEQYKLSMFLWDNQAPTIPPLERAPDFPRPHRRRPWTWFRHTNSKPRRIALRFVKSTLKPN
ncbi:MAG: TolC family protein [Nitrospiraceae bacterium]